MVEICSAAKVTVRVMAILLGYVVSDGWIARDGIPIGLTRLSSPSGAEVIKKVGGIVSEFRWVVEGVVVCMLMVSGGLGLVVPVIPGDIVPRVMISSESVSTRSIMMVSVVVFVVIISVFVVDIMGISVDPDEGVGRCGK